MSLTIDMQSPRDGSKHPAAAPLNITGKVDGLTSGKVLQIRIQARYLDGSDAILDSVSDIEIT